MSVAQQWQAMLTTGLLGTDRREPPAPPRGLLADLAADEPRRSPSQRMLQQVAAAAVLQRAGLRPAPAAPMLQQPPHDPRPITPPAATATWHRVVADWPVLEDEWLHTVVTNGWRVAPELAVALLGRHRSDTTRRTRAIAATGPLAGWLIGHAPHLAGSSRRAPRHEDLAELAELPTLADLAALLHAPPAAVARAVAGGLHSGAYGTTHRAVLINFVASVRADSLDELADALARANAVDLDPSRSTIGLAFTLADLARLRRRMLIELEPR